MIKLTRVDDRLVHGQVAFTWTPALGVDCLLIANDKIAQDEFMKMTLSLAKPAGTKLLIKSINDAALFLNNDNNRSLKVLLLTNSVKDALDMASNVPEITSVNFGGLRMKNGARMISKAIALTDEDIAQIKVMADKGIEMEVRQVPTDKRQFIDDLLQLPKE